MYAAAPSAPWRKRPCSHRAAGRAPGRAYDVDVRPQRAALPPSLAPFVRGIRRHVDVPADEPYLRLPDGALELSLRLDRRGAPVLNVLGPRLGPLEKRTEASREALVVRFRPGGAYPLLGMPISKLLDRVVPLEQLWPAGARALASALVDERSDARAAALQHVLTSRLSAGRFEPSQVVLVRRALRLLGSLDALPDVAALSQRLAVSPRHLRRGFVEVVGIGPKAYLRVLRFQRARRAIRRNPGSPLCRIARAVGYYDEAHMAADFRALAGSTAGALRSATQLA